MKNTDNMSENILEIRYKNNTKFFDCKGQWIEVMSSIMSLPNWKADENVVEISNEDKTEKAFFSFRNFGYKIIKPPTNNYFHDRATKFLNEHFRTRAFSDIENIFIQRIGVRSRHIMACNHSFEQLREIYLSKYINTSNVNKTIENATIDDVGILLNFKDNYGNFNTNSGPMEKEQIKQFFDWLEDKDDICDVGLYIDIDYWVAPQETMKKNDIINKVQKFAKAINTRKEQIENFILS